MSIPDRERLSRRRLLARGGAVAGAVGLAPLLGSADAFATSEATPRRGGELVIARSTEPTQFDPAASIVSGDVWTLDKFFEPLYAVDAKGKLVPWLARSYEVAKGGKQFTFHLRPGVKFSDGSPLTSADVKFSIDRARKGKGPLSFLDGPIVSISTPSSSTVVFHLSAPWAPFLSDISAFTNGILPHNFGGKSEKAFFAKPIGTGPFTLGAFTKGSSVRLVRNPHYWRAGKPYVDSVRINLVPDDNTRVLQLKGGQVGIIEGVPAASVKDLKSAKNVRVGLFSAWSADLVFMNQKMKPFQDRNVRRAIAYGIDRKAIVAATVFGTAQVGGSFFPPLLQYYAASTPVLQHDPEKAKAALAASSAKGGFDTEIMVPSGNVVWNSTAQLIQAQLQPIGINVKVTQKEIGDFKSSFAAFKYQIMINNAINDISDPDEMASFQVDAVKGGSDSFWTGYNNPAAIKLVRQAQSQFNSQKRAALYRKIQAIVAQDAPFIALSYPPYIWGSSKKVNGFAVNPGGAFRLEDVWLSA
jgi:peptide/nickel transport system substrate-binding protein